MREIEAPVSKHNINTGAQIHFGHSMPFSSTYIYYISTVGTSFFALSMAPTLQWAGYPLYKENAVFTLGLLLSKVHCTWPPTSKGSVYLQINRDYNLKRLLFPSLYTVVGGGMSASSRRETFSYLAGIVRVSQVYTSCERMKVPTPHPLGQSLFSSKGKFN